MRQIYAMSDPRYLFIPYEFFPAVREISGVIIDRQNPGFPIDWLDVSIDDLDRHGLHLVPIDELLSLELEATVGNA